MVTLFLSLFCWQGAYAQRADLVLWPSAYGGGLALRSYAALYHYHVVPNGWGDVRGLTGDVVPSLREVRLLASCNPRNISLYFFST